MSLIILTVVLIIFGLMLNTCIWLYKEFRYPGITLLILFLSAEAMLGLFSYNYGIFSYSYRDFLEPFFSIFISWTLNYFIAFFISITLIFLYRISNKYWWFYRSLVLGFCTVLIFGHYAQIMRNNFPGSFASVEVRHEWALKTFGSTYTNIGEFVQTCVPVVDKLGDIKFFAPTEGKNLYEMETAPFINSSVYFTLLLKGNKSEGIAALHYQDSHTGPLEIKLNEPNNNFSGTLRYREENGSTLRSLKLNSEICIAPRPK